MSSELESQGHNTDGGYDATEGGDDSYTKKAAAVSGGASGGDDVVSIETGSVDKLFTNEFDPVYLQKSKVLSDAIDEIGMGKYQWLLFVVAGFGWLADNSWPVVTSLVLPQVAKEYLPEGSTNGPFLTLAQNLGLLAGAVFWSFSSDIWGRRIAFNLTFLVTGVWGVVAGSAPNFAAVGVFMAFYSFGVGGNLPVDSAVFLEFLPSTHQYLLTIESVWWALGQLITTAIAYGFMSKYACAGGADGCTRAENMGWRYLFFTVGALSLFFFFIRFAFFRLYESPKFYLSRGEEDKAVDIIHKLAAYNGKETSFSIEKFQAIDAYYGVESAAADSDRHLTGQQAVKQRLSKFSFSHVREVFATKKLAFSSSIIILVWAIIGVAFPLYNAFLPYYLQTRSQGQATAAQSLHTSYRNSLIIASLGVPASIIAGGLVELRIGRKGTLAASTVLTGVFLLAGTTAKTSNQLLGWSCGYNFVSNIMYGVLYAATAEMFPARIRGTGIGLASSANRVLGVFAPIIAKYANLTTSVPIFVSGALFLVAGFLALLLPYEPRGRASL